MSFLVKPLLSAVPAVAGLFGGGPKAPQVDLSQYNKLLQGQQGDVAGLNKQADYGVNSGTSAIDPTLNYYRSLTGGNSQAAAQAVAPETNSILQQYDAARKSAAMGPRGGGATRAMASLPFQKIGSIANLLWGARNNAAQNLGQLGTNLLAQGNQARTAATTAQQGAANSALQAQGLSLDAQKAAYQAALQRGSGLGSIFNGLLFGSGGGGGGGASGGGVPFVPSLTNLPLNTVGGGGNLILGGA